MLPRIKQTFLSILRFLRIGRRYRDIYRYFNGHRWVYGDPMAIARAINTDPVFTFDKHWPGVVKGNYIDIGIAAAATRRAFNVQPLDENGKGLNEAECVNLLDLFCQYCDDLKKNINPQPILQPPTEAASSTKTPATTKCNSDCGSILSEQCTDEPGSSAKELETH